MSTQPLLKVNHLTKMYGSRIGYADVSFDLWPGEVLAIVGESGSGKTTLLSCLSTRLKATSGSVEYHMRDGTYRELSHLTEAERRFLMRTDWGFVHQNPADGLRMTVSVGANVGARLMAIGHRHYGEIREAASDWLSRVEISPSRIDDQPRAFSGGMRQRLQIAHNLITGPRLVFMDEPTSAPQSGSSLTSRPRFGSTPPTIRHGARHCITTSPTGPATIGRRRTRWISSPGDGRTGW